MRAHWVQVSSYSVIWMAAELMNGAGLYRRVPGVLQVTPARRQAARTSSPRPSAWRDARANGRLALLEHSTRLRALIVRPGCAATPVASAAACRGRWPHPAA